MAELPGAGARASRSALPSAGDRGGLPCWLPMPPPPSKPHASALRAPREDVGERPAGGTVGPLLPLRSTISHPLPQHGALHSVQKPVTYLQPTADGPAQGPPAPTGASQPCPGPRAAGGTGRRAPEAELRLGALLPDSRGPPSLCCLCSTQAHSRTHSCTHVHRHTHTFTHPHIVTCTCPLIPICTHTQNTQLHTHAHSHPHTNTHAFSRLHSSSIHTHTCSHLYACTHSCTHTHALVRTRTYPHTHTLTGHSSCLMEPRAGYTSLEMNG